MKIRPLVITWVALLALLCTSAGSALLPLGWFNTAIGLVIALVKALLVAIVFMRLFRAHALLRIAAVTGVVTMALLFILSGADYATRPLLPASYQQPDQVAPAFGSRSGLERVGPVADRPSTARP
jgi:cytochrome c oxidase subunit 4